MRVREVMTRGAECVSPEATLQEPAEPAGLRPRDFNGGEGGWTMQRTNRGIDPGLAFLGGLGLGAVAMYFADPAQGRRRRALAWDQANRALNELGECLDATWKDV